MTVAAYASDLTDIFLFESTSGVAAYGGGGSGLGAGVDFAMEGTNAVDKQITNTEKGFLFDNVSNFSVGADDHFFIWIMGATPGVNDTRNNRGIVACIGDSISAFVKFHVDGSDTLPLGGGQVYAIRFINTALTNFRTLVGTPGSTPSQIGGGLNTTATVKGANLGVDGARIGTGYDITGGTGADDPADFAGIASDDESTSEGVFQTAPGGYTLQGKLRIGSSANACELTDENALIAIKDTRHSLTDFTEFLVENAATILTLGNITFLALGTNNPGRFEMITSAATVILTGCAFQGFGVTVLGTGAVMTSCQWLASEQIIQNGAALDACTVDNSLNADAVLADDLDGITDSTFVSAGTGHAIAYAPIGAGPFTETLDGNTFTGYAGQGGTASNRSLLINPATSSADITINVQNGATPSYELAAGYTGTFVIQQTVTVKVTILDNTGTALQNSRVLMEADAGGDLSVGTDILSGLTNASGVLQDTGFNFTNSQPVKGVVRKSSGSPYFKDGTITGSIQSSGYDSTIQLVLDE